MGFRQVDEPSIIWETFKLMEVVMLSIQAPGAVRTMMVSFRRGDYIIESLRELIEREGIDAALITSGIGSFDICKLHTIANTGLPPEERYLTLEGPLEIGSLQGSVAGGEPHIHVVVHDVAKDQLYAGHLEPGSRCCFRAELGMIVLDGVKTRRVIDPETKLVDIVPAEG
ncbi:MAG: PPC domain-containing DNA-binding protein [bacterium]